MKFRHGDVLIEKVDSINGKKLDHLIIAEGEVTGHAHRITKGDAELYEKDGVMFLHVESEEALLTHEEHGPITLPKGDFKITIQREYIPNAWKNVVD